MPIRRVARWDSTHHLKSPERIQRVLRVPGCTALSSSAPCTCRRAPGVSNAPDGQHGGKPTHNAGTINRRNRNEFSAATTAEAGDRARLCFRTCVLLVVLVVAERRCACRRSTMMRRLLEGIRQPDQPRLAKSRS